MTGSASHRTKTPPSIRFRPMTMADLPRMLRWLSDPDVKKWYGQRVYTPGELAAKYGPRIRREVPVQSYIILVGNRPAGYIQTYRISDFPDYNLHVGAEPGDAGVDLFIGESRVRGGGTGTRVMEQFLQTIVFGEMACLRCIIGPDPDNFAAIRCYEKTGFRHFKTIHTGGVPETEYLMILHAPDTVLPGKEIP